MLKHLLFFFLMLFAAEAAFSQMPNLCPSDNTPPADDCPDACIYCNLDTYTGSTIGYTNSFAPGFCGTVENDQWLGFVAGATSAVITVIPSNCVLGNGMQVAIYPGCLSNPIACNGGMNGGGNTPLSLPVTLTPGNVYYLMVDGWAGDLCDFTVSVSPPGAAIGIQFSTQEVPLCPNQTFTVNGVAYSAPAVVKDTIPSNNGGCDTIRTYNLTELPYVMADKTVQFCPGDSVVIDGMVFTDPGQYTSDVPLPSMTGGCDSIISYTFEYLPQPTVSQTIFLHSGQPYVINGDIYFAPDTVQALIPAPVGCDTLVTYLLLLDLSIQDTCMEAQSFLKLFGEPFGFERGNVLCPSADGNFYIAGEKGLRSLLMKVSPNGAVLWSRSFLPVALSSAHITDLVEDSEGMLAGCAIVGEADVNLKSYAFRYNPSADNIIWSKLMEQQSPEAYAILEKEPGGNFLLLTSPQLAVNVDDAEIWELNRNTGALIGGLTHRYNLGISDVWNSMLIHDGALYVIGRHIPSTQSVPIPPLDKLRMGLSRLDLATGNPVWSRLSHVDTSEVALLFGQDFLVHDNALLSVYNGTDSDDPNATPVMFLQKTSLDGDLMWVKRYDTPAPEGILASDIQQMSDGYVITGLVNMSSAWQKTIMKTDFDGNVVWTRRFADTNPGNLANTLNLGQHQSTVVNDVLYLTTSTAGAPSDIVFLKMTSDGEISDSCGYIEPMDVIAEAVPNPANISVQMPFNQFIGQSSNAPATTQSETIPVSTYCVRCVQNCDDTLDLGPDIILCYDSTVTFNAGSGFVSYMWQDGSTDSTFTTDLDGIYWVEVTNECGDIQRDSVFLGFSLVGDVKLKDDTLCIGQSLTLNVPGFDVYDWSPSTGLDCDTCATVIIQPDVTTTYTLFAENAAGCTKYDTFTVVVLPLETSSEVIEFCPGKTITIGGMDYTESGTVIDTIPGTAGCDTIVTYTLILLPYNVDSTTVEFCEGETITIGGMDYTQSGTVIDTIPGTAGCDTIVTYTLIMHPYNTDAQTIEFCPGETVTIGGVDYDQSGTVLDTVPGTVGCDTIITYTLIKLPYNTSTQTVEFCSGDSVVINGVTYYQPGTVVDTVSASVGCDTIVTYTLQFIDTPNSSVSIDCPADIDVVTDPGTGPVVVNYDQPDVSSDCQCPGIALTQTQGPASGSMFPVGVTKVCYQAKDSCGNTATCCFDVSVTEESPCDVKMIGCMKYELLGITRGSSSLNLSYRIRVTNNCTNKMIYTAIQIPDGMVAVEPANNSVFTAGSGRQYDVRNPNYSPFYSVRYKSKLDSIASGQSDIFEYTLPPQINPSYIHVTSRLYPQLFFEAHINTFYCPIEIVQDKPEQRIDNPVNREPVNFKVFPNPTSGALFADFSDWNGEQLRVRLIGSQGQQVQLLTLQASDVPQPVQLPDGLSSGLYFLEVLRGNGEKQTVRFVLQR